MEPDTLQNEFQLLSQNFLSLSKKLQDQLNLVEEKEKKIQETEEKMKQNASKAKMKIKLDVGGKIFASSKSTLMALEGTYFHAMLSSGHWEPDEDGYYFIDRNPKHFPVILDYLRTGKIDFSDYSSKDFKKLVEDLDYYQIKLPIIIPSTILNDTMKYTLGKMLPPNAQKFRLVHNSNQGTDAVSFDASVRGLANTLIIIRATTNYVFGAFVLDKWGETGGWVKGNMETFLFSLGNGQSPPVKLLHSGNGNGIHISSCGVHLGNGGDLVAFCSHSCSIPKTYTIVAPGYEAHPINELLLAGEANWKPQFMEVFVLDNK